LHISIASFAVKNTTPDYKKGKCIHQQPWQKLVN